MSLLKRVGSALAFTQVSVTIKPVPVFYFLFFCLSSWEMFIQFGKFLFLRCPRKLPAHMGEGKGSVAEKRDPRVAEDEIAGGALELLLCQTTELLHKRGSQPSI